MDSSKFNIFEAVKNAYLFVGREWVYLLKAGALPVVMQICTSLFVQLVREDSSILEGYLWGLPATALFSWFVFLEMRLLLLKEKIDELPHDVGYLIDRQNAMRIAVLTSLLFNMGISFAMTILLGIVESGKWGISTPLTLAGSLLAGVAFWSIRFGILPILAAVHYPFRPVLLQTRGAMFSLRLAGMALVCMFPVALVFQIALSFFVDKTADIATAPKLTMMEQVGIIVVSAPVSLLVAALLNASAAYALKQIIGSRQNGALA